MKQLCILDLDETLVHATEAPLERPCDLMAGPFLVYTRPFVDEFFAQVAQWFDLAVWTTSSEAYAEAIVRNVFPNHAQLAFIWARQRCTAAKNRETDERFWIKDLKKVKRQGYPLERVLVIDNSPEKIQRHYGNLIQVSPYLGAADDDELTLLLPFLKWLTTVGDVRKVEKRNWRE
jgi:Dullard-like phosphatase family protein